MPLARVAIRENLTAWLPALIVSSYLLASLDEMGTLERLLVAVLIGFVGQGFALMVYMFITAGVRHIAGEDSADLGELDPKGLQVVAALTLTAVVYVWLQWGKEQAVRRIAECVEDNHYEVEAGVQSPRDLVTSCASPDDGGGMDDY